MSEKLYVEPHEDVRSVIQKLTTLHESEIELIIPSGARMLQNIVDAHLLKDAAEKQEKSITIVTNDMAGKLFAERAGMAVVTPEGSRELPGAVLTASRRKISDIVPRTRIVRKPKRSQLRPLSGRTKRNAAGASVAESSFLERYKNREIEDRASSLGPKPSRGPSRQRRFSIRTVVIVAVIASLLLAGTVLGSVLPRAELVLHPAKEKQSIVLELTVSEDAAGIDAEQSLIPGEVMSLEKSDSQTFAATGSSAASSNKARGRITIYNEFSAQPQPFIPSRFQSENGTIFWTTTDVTVPGAVFDGTRLVSPGTIEVEVEAAEEGESSAIGPSRFTMPALQGTARGARIYAISTTAMQIPDAGNGAAVVSEADIENAHRTLRDRLVSQVAELKTTLSSELTFFPEAYTEEVLEQTTNVSPGARAENFVASMRMASRAVVFRKADLDSLIVRAFEGEIEEGYRMLPDSSTIEFAEPPVVDYEQGTVEATLEVSVDVIEDFDAQMFSDLVRGKSREEIKEVLAAHQMIESVEVKLSPFWVSSVPEDEGKVRIRVAGLE
jgi:hypothetical protein